MLFESMKHIVFSSEGMIELVYVWSWSYKQLHGMVDYKYSSAALR